MPTASFTDTRIAQTAASLGNRIMQRAALNPLEKRVTRRDGWPVMHGHYPVLGHMPALMHDPLAFGRRAERELGPLFWIDMGFGKWTLLCLDPEGFEILRNQATSSKHIRKIAPDLFGESVIGQDGARHRHQRGAMGAAFTPRGLMENAVGELLASVIERHVRDWIDRREVRILVAAREMVLALILRMMGVPEQDLSAWREDYEELMLLSLMIPIDLPGSPLRRGRAARARLDARFAELVREARANPESKGLLAEMARGRDEDGQGLAERDLLDNLRLLVLAGHETTASMITWIVAAMAQHEEIWEALRREATAAEDMPRSPATLKSFPYAEALFRELLRLHPPLTRDTRIVTGELALGGREVPVGAMVTISIQHMSRHPSLYAAPDDLRVERWLGRSGSPSALELMQFGGGPHFCLGYHVAWMESVQLAVALARELSARGLRPVLTTPPPAPRYLSPILQPDARARVRFEAR